MQQILCVDDNLDHNNVICTILGTAGYEVTPATSADQAMSSITNQPYALYILDVEMPYLDGLELCRMIRAGDPDVPIIIHSARAYEADKCAGLAAGATRYLIKPDGIDVIDSVVRDLLSKKKTVQATEVQ